MIALFVVAATAAIQYIDQVKTDAELIGTYKNHHEFTRDGVLYWMEYVDKGVTNQEQEPVMEFQMYIRNTVDIKEASTLRETLRALIKGYGIRAWSDAGQNIATGVTTTTLRIEGDAVKISITLGMLRNQVGGFFPVANA